MNLIRTAVTLLTVAGIHTAFATEDPAIQHFHIADMGLAVTIAQDGALAIRKTTAEEKPAGKTVESWNSPKGDITTGYIEFQLPGHAAPADAEDSPVMILRKLNGTHPGVWKDEADEDAEEEFDMPGVLSAKAKRAGYQQLLDVTSGKPGALGALEWYGPLGEIEPNTPAIPPFVEWQALQGAAYEIIRPRLFATTRGGTRGFEAISLSGQDTGFSPAFEIHLIHPGLNVWIEMRLPLQNEPSIAPRRMVPTRQIPAWARRNYDLLKSGFDGPEYQTIRDKIEKLRTIARSLD